MGNNVRLSAGMAAWRSALLLRMGVNDHWGPHETVVVVVGWWAELRLLELRNFKKSLTSELI